jgi:methylmalonyl-CoA mutase
MVRLGAAAQRKERATFAETVFALAGIVAVSHHGLAHAPSPPRGEVNADLAGLAASFEASGARIACLCASDEVYGQTAEPAAKVLRAAGAEALYLVGDPDADYAKSGIGSLVHVGCNVLEILREALAHATGAKGN